jgi:ribonuclease P/MRP protein subunit POP5
MVRIKHRYLLVNILYPEQEARKSKQSGSGGKDDLPYTVQFRRPGPEQLNGKLLTRLIREGVADLFGDYGSGMVSGSLVGKDMRASTHYMEIAAHSLDSQVLLPSNKHSHHPCRSCALPYGVGCIGFYNFSATEVSRFALRHASRACLWHNP